MIQAFIILSTLLIGHVLGDFVFQNEFQAMNKKKMWLATWGHGFAYACGIVIIFILMLVASGKTLNADWIWVPLVLFITIGTVHGLTDRYYNGKKIYDFLIHLVQNSIILIPLVVCYIK